MEPLEPTGPLIVSVATIGAGIGIAIGLAIYWATNAF